MVSKKQIKSFSKTIIELLVEYKKEGSGDIEWDSFINIWTEMPNKEKKEMMQKFKDQVNDKKQDFIECKSNIFDDIELCVVFKLNQKEVLEKGIDVVWEYLHLLFFICEGSDATKDIIDSCLSSRKILSPTKVKLLTKVNTINNSKAENIGLDTIISGLSGLSSLSGIGGLSSGAGLEGMGNLSGLSDILGSILSNKKLMDSITNQVSESIKDKEIVDNFEAPELLSSLLDGTGNNRSGINFSEIVTNISANIKDQIANGELEL